MTWLLENSVTVVRRHRLAIGLAALALAVYLPAIWWGLPVATSGETIHGWDVDGVAGIAVLAEFHNLLSHASADWYVAYPLFHYFLLGICYAPYLAVLWLSGGLKAPGAAYPFGFQNPVTSLVVMAGLGRALTLCMAVGTVLAAYRAASIVWNRRAGVAAALIVMLNAPMVYRARTGNLDVPVLFWTALGVVVLARISVDGLSLRRAIWLGAFAALATATKDQAYGGWLGAIAVAFFLHWRRLIALPNETGGSLWKAPAVIVFSGLACYTLAAGIVVSPHRFLAHTRFLLSYKEARFAFAETDLQRGRDLIGFLRLAWDIARITILAVGIPAAAMAMMGIWSERKMRFVWLLGGMAAGYLGLVLVPIAHMQFRYALLPAFLLAFPAAGWFSAAFERTRSSKRLAQISGAVALAWLIAGAFNLTYQMWRDARYQAGDWLAAHLRPGQTVGFFGDKGQLPVIPKGVIVERLKGGLSTSAILQSAPVDVLLIIPDYTTPPDGERSLFLAKSDYTALAQGRFPYVMTAKVDVKPLWGVRFPFVNPPVRIYARSNAPIRRTSGL